VSRCLHRRCALLCALAAIAGAGLTAAPALAAGNAIINDCQTHGRLTATYSVGALRHALHTLPASAKEYTDCYDVINQALLTATGRARKPGGGATGGGSGGSAVPTPVIVIIVVLILAAVTFGALALRRRRMATDGPGRDPANAPGTTRLMSAPEERGEDPTRVQEPPEDDRDD